MSFTNKTTEAFQLVATRLNTLYERDGDLDALSTSEKSSIVGALNEIHADLVAATDTANAAAVIDDSTPSANTVYSSNKVMAEIAASVAAALEGNDVSDLADAIAALQAADMGLVSANAPQDFSPAQEAQARTNIGAVSQSDFEANATATLQSINDNTASIATNTAGLAATVAATAANTTSISGLTADVASNDDDISQLQADLGDEASFDPVAAMNAILTF